jgi:hypothetical protein
MTRRKRTLIAIVVVELLPMTRVLSLAALGLLLGLSRYSMDSSAVRLCG